MSIFSQNNFFHWIIITFFVIDLAREIIIITIKNIYKMKHLGVLLIILAAIVLVACEFTGNVNNNVILFGSVGVMIIGLILHIWLNKKYVD